MTGLETALITVGGSLLAGSGVKIWEKRNAVTPEQCNKNHEREEGKIDRLEGKIDEQSKMIRSIVTQTITDSDKQEEILNRNGANG